MEEKKEESSQAVIEIKRKLKEGSKWKPGGSSTGSFYTQKQGGGFSIRPQSSKNGGSYMEKIIIFTLVLLVGGAIAYRWGKRKGRDHD